jgi:hypothetical protein
MLSSFLGWIVGVDSIKDSGSQVGSIRSANQGVFSISAADAGSGMAPGEKVGGAGGESGCEHHEEGACGATVDYFLVK